MIVQRISALTGRSSEMDLPVTEEEIARWRGGELVQDVWPSLSPDQREFLITGSTPEEWDEVFGEEDSGDDE